MGYLENVPQYGAISSASSPGAVQTPRRSLIWLISSCRRPDRSAEVAVNMTGAIGNGVDAEIASMMATLSALWPWSTASLRSCLIAVAQTPRSLRCRQDMANCAGAMAYRIAGSPGNRPHGGVKKRTVTCEIGHRHAPLHPAASGEPITRRQRSPFDARRFRSAAIRDFMARAPQPMVPLCVRGRPA
jgi:hypothetical protein